jgi:hypothetical protein
MDDVALLNDEIESLKKELKDRLVEAITDIDIIYDDKFNFYFIFHCKDGYYEFLDKEKGSDLFKYFDYKVYLNDSNKLVKILLVSLEDILSNKDLDKVTEFSVVLKLSIIGYSSYSGIDINV